MRRLKLFMPLLGLIFVLALSGCLGRSVQGTKFTAFKESTAALGTQSRACYEEVVGLWETLTAECLASSSDKNSYDRALYGGAPPCGFDDNLKVAIKFENPKPRLDARLQALDALSRYAAHLNMLATTDYVAGVDASAEKLNSSLEKLRSAFQAKGVLKDQELAQAPGLIEQAVKDAGGLYVEGRRKEALARILEKTQPGIKTLATLIVKDNGEIANLVKGYGRSYVRLAQESRPMKEHNSILAYDAAVLKVDRTARNLEAAITAQDQALLKLPGAHANLLESLNEKEKSLDRLEEFVGAAEQALVYMNYLRNN